MSEQKKSLSQRASTAWKGIVGFGAISGIVALSQNGWDSLIVHTRPIVSAPGPATDPFLLPFSVKNPSTAFTMWDTEFVCSLHTLQQPGVQVFGLELATNKITADIPPGDTLLIKCNFGGVLGKIAPTARIGVIPKLKYRTMGIQRENDDASFTWLPDAQPPHWVEGTMLKGPGTP